MTSNQICNFQSPVNLSGNVSFAPLAAWQWFVATACVVGVIASGTDKQVSLKRRAGRVPNHLCPLHLIRLIIGVVKAVSVCATVIVANLRAVTVAIGMAGRVNESGAGDKGLHGESPNGGDAQHDAILLTYSAHAIANRDLFRQMYAVWPVFLRKCRQTGLQNNPIATHFAGCDAALPAELKHPLLTNTKDCGGFGWRANQIKCGLFHALQHSGVAA